MSKLRTLAEAARTLLRLDNPEDPYRSASVRLTTQSGKQATLDVPLPDGPGEDGAIAGEVEHSPDYRSWTWYGRSYRFTRTQAACVRVLWDARRRGIRCLSQADILREADSYQERLGSVFRDRNGRRHPAWGAMLVRCGDGMYRLAVRGDESEEKSHDSAPDA